MHRILLERTRALACALSPLCLIMPFQITPEYEVRVTAMRIYVQLCCQHILHCIGNSQETAWGDAMEFFRLRMMGVGIEDLDYSESGESETMATEETRTPSTFSPGPPSLAPSTPEATTELD